MSLSSVGAARPKLSFTMTAGKDAPSLKSINVTLPRGLHFTNSRATVTVTRRKGKQLKFTARLVHGALVLTLGGTPTGSRHDLVAAPGRERQPDRRRSRATRRDE